MTAEEQRSKEAEEPVRCGGSLRCSTWRGQRCRGEFSPTHALWLKKLGLPVAVLIGIGLTVVGSRMQHLTVSDLFTLEPAIAQLPGYQEVWRQVYQQLPDLPLENQYVNQESGKADPNNTLMSRLIRYHLFVKGRPPNYRLDWKLTLADYLDANELMEEGVYPGYDTLRKNPMAGDREAIQRLSRTQRNALVQVLVNIFNPNTAAESQPGSQSTPAANTAPMSPQKPQPSTPLQPKPGDARLLMP